MTAPQTLSSVLVIYYRAHHCAMCSGLKQAT